MTFKPLFYSLFLACAFYGTAQQQQKKETLFTIDTTPYYTDEFVRVYQKNLDLVKDESQKDLDQYLDLYLGYKLKVAKAKKLDLHTKPNYINELNTYRGQLAKNYLTDSKVTNELITEGYERMKKEIRASHILILVNENAAPADTLSAYTKIVGLQKRAIAGEDFGTLAQQYSEDPSAKDNKGDLGYFSAFRMVYPFETAAYTTPVGTISKPVRTRFGYHILNIHDVRDNRGEVSVAHIMLLHSDKDDPQENATIEQKIQDIYKKLQQGESFETLAQQFSQDQSSSVRGGALARFGSGQLSSEVFENTAFSLTPESPLSKPIKTQFGWHIVKLLEKHEMKSFDALKGEIESKISRDDRSRIIAESMNEKLRKKYPVKRQEKVYQATRKAITDAVYTQSWDLPTDLTPYKGTLVSFDKKQLTGEDFLNYIATYQKQSEPIKPLSKWIDYHYDNFIEIQLNHYYDANLENEFPEFSAVMDEYRDGLLLFDLMETEIWQRAKTDTVGLTSFYENNLKNYQWKNRYDVLIATTTNEAVAQKAHGLLKKKATAATLKEKLNTAETVSIMVAEGVFEEGNESLPKTVTLSKGLQPVLKEGAYYYIVLVNEVLPAGPKALDETKGRVINDYQNYLESNWLSELKKEFTIQVNQDVFTAVKKQIKN
ncbi:peptidylprolyl isomerase [Flavobacterium orientale]|uniref:Peptidyl-prolyl cis-trans isomerase n=1 Tax=Flavobacterium orientale TaxID=1756020 RepID=A0A916Y4A6_9FLAO|nr:peptidylprolyl isomerase [Flavobacterium orientale]GGD30076.1 peptidyl-prolyl cis-trans isomerase [Flavobacterium orientale]